MQSSGSSNYYLQAMLGSTVSSVVYEKVGSILYNEYSVAGKNVWQIRADHNARPSEEVLHYVNDIWLPYANRKLKKIA